jgi:hypothetical protein
MITRLLIEGEGQDETEHEYRRAQRTVHNLMGAGNTEYVFDMSLFDALYNGSEAWKAIKAHDEIYCSTSLVPLIGAMGSHTLFNGMMYRTIEEGVTGKKVYILNEYGNIQWDNLEAKLIGGAFKKNYLYVLAKDRNTFEQVDIDNLLRELE